MGENRTLGVFMKQVNIPDRDGEPLTLEGKIVLLLKRADHMFWYLLHRRRGFTTIIPRLGRVTIALFGGEQKIECVIRPLDTADSPSRFTVNSFPELSAIFEAVERRHAESNFPPDVPAATREKTTPSLP